MVSMRQSCHSPEVAEAAQPRNPLHIPSIYARGWQVARWFTEEEHDGLKASGTAGTPECCAIQAHNTSLQTRGWQMKPVRMEH